MKEFYIKKFNNLAAFETEINDNFADIITIQSIYPKRYVLHSFSETKDGYTAVFQLVRVKS